MSHEKKNCLNCGKKVSRCEVLYCSKRCYHEYKRKEFEKTIQYNKCIICGKPTVNEKYCSMKCLGKDISRIDIMMKNLPNETYWTDEEVEILKKNYGVMPISDLCNLLHRNQYAVIQYASKHNISSKRFWTDDEVEFLLQNYNDINLLTNTLRKSKSAIINKLSTINGFRDELGNSIISPQEYITKFISDELGYHCISEFRVDRYLLDIVLVNMDIEIQGSYWHCDERIFNDSKTDMQEQRIQRDKKRKDHLESIGYSVIYVWEYDIISNPEMVKKKLSNKIEEHLTTLSSVQKLFWKEKIIKQIDHAIKNEHKKKNPSNKKLEHLNNNLHKTRKWEWPN